MPAVPDSKTTVWVTHLPTGIVEGCGEYSSPLLNEQIATRRLCMRLEDAEYQKLMEVHDYCWDDPEEELEEKE